MASFKSSSPLSAGQSTPASNVGTGRTSGKSRRRSKKASTSSPPTVVTLPKQPWTVSQMRIARAIIFSNEIVREQNPDLPLLPAQYSVKHSEVGNENTFSRLRSDIEKIAQRRQQHNSPPPQDQDRHDRASLLRELMAQIHKDLLEGATVEPGFHFAWIETELVMEAHSIVHLSTKLFVR